MRDLDWFSQPLSYIRFRIKKLDVLFLTCTKSRTVINRHHITSVRPDLRKEIIYDMHPMWPIPLFRFLHFWGIKKYFLSRNILMSSLVLSKTLVSRIIMARNNQEHLPTVRHRTRSNLYNKMFFMSFLY